MSSFGLDIKVRNLFFDRAKVVKAVSAANRRNLSRAGAFIRTAARSSIKVRKYGTYSRPGSPPFDHTGFALQRENRRRKRAGQEKLTPKRGHGLRSIRTILFAYDEQNESVVIGPVKFNGGKQSGQTVPQILEFGGQTTVGTGNKKRTVSIAPRPFMAPALRKELPNLPMRWRGTVRA